ncbi:glycosyltransferase family 39 protein [bacterium]|nr:glycosyltransferase family 39 protein [bacterium]MBU1984583.1 glycosyltransferase family 39 protein [bacterium]
MPNRRHIIYLTVILILAAGVRLWGLADESLWVDEGFTADRASSSLLALMAELTVETQGVAYYLAEWVWCHVFGTSEFALRFPSVVYGTLAVFALYLLGGRLFSPTAGLLSALLLALNPFALFYSQDARPYALFLFSAIASLYFFLLFLELWTKGRLWGYLIFTVLTLYTHAFGPLILVVHVCAWWLLRRDARFPVAQSHPRSVVKLIAVSAALYLPQLLILSRSIVEKLMGTGRASWIETPSLTAPFDTFKAYFMAPELAWATGLIILLGLAVGRRRQPSSGRSLGILLAVMVMFIIFPWLVSRYITPVYVDRYTIPALLAVLLALGWALSVFSLRWRAIAFAVVLVLTALVLRHYYTGLDKDPWRQAAETVELRARSGDKIVIIKSYVKEAFTYYYQPPHEVKILAPWQGELVPREFDEPGRVILVWSYVGKRTARVDSLMARVEHGRRAVESVRVAEREKRNPYALWLPDITVTVYEPDPAGNHKNP